MEPLGNHARKGLAVLGSTGSIGCSTLEVVRRYPERFRVVSLVAGNNVEALKMQVAEFRPLFVSVSSKDDAVALKRELPPGVKTGYGTEGAIEAASYEGVHMAVAAISGGAGLMPAYAAIEAGKDLALANKEALVMAGPIVMGEADRRGVRILPVDSEHSAVFQSLLGHRKEDIDRIILTASGGPFLNAPLERLCSVTPEDALEHPRWKMGRKITVDSATMLNKGLEVIEARWLFGVPASRISVCIHPQSIVHSMVEYVDGSIIAQMGVTDMKGPIAYALSYPERLSSCSGRLSLAGLSLDFSDPDPERFPCLSLAYDALEAGGTAPAVLNAADEAAVDAFLSGRIPFTGIREVISAVLERHGNYEASSIEGVMEADRWARKEAGSIISGMKAPLRNA